MKENKNIWIFGLFGTLALLVVPISFFWPQVPQPLDDPWANVPEHLPHTDHVALMEGPYETGQEVTAACLECHEDSAGEVMHTSHWTWESEPVQLPGRDELVTIGKKTSLNNFCIGIQSNWPKCTSCHIGYGWEDETFNFAEQENVDCLACHADSGTYGKGLSGNPLESVDLAVAAQSVGSPTRENCGQCHFNGGGGNGVKHGDLDESLYFPQESLDVHMGELDFLCTDCHQANDHEIAGRSLSYNVDSQADSQYRAACTDCHSDALHEDERITAHIETVACQTCHIPAIALKDPTKTEWDWSTAGQDLEEDPHVYLKIKGSFVYEFDFKPEYTWYNGQLADRYIMGDVLDPAFPAMINLPAGSIQDVNAQIWPFKIHRAQQPYDTVNNYLVQPKTVGDGGYWTDFDWQQAIKLGMEVVGLPYSGEYGFTETWMYWPTTHMVQPAENALQCASCHSEDGLMDWNALGYPGDPVEWGGR